ncbi:hypothetical protein Tco_0391505, partial [Tanacetum coccineum]
DIRSNGRSGVKREGLAFTELNDLGGNAKTSNDLGGNEEPEHKFCTELKSDRAEASV